MEKVELKRHKKHRVRSPSYPAVHLEEAIRRAGQLKEFGGRHQVTVSFVLQHWGYRPQSTNGMKIVAALNYFGLLKTTGTGEARKAELTDRAWRILVDHKGSLDRQRAIQDAALSPKLYKELWEKWGADMPPKPEIRAYLVLEKKFNERTVNDFLVDYQATVKFAELAKADAGIEEEEIDEEGEFPADTDTLEEENQEVAEKSRGGRGLIERITGPDGSITLQFSAEPSYDQYKFLGAYIRLRLMTLDPGRAKQDLDGD